MFHGELLPCGERRDAGLLWGGRKILLLLLSGENPRLGSFDDGVDAFLGVFGRQSCVNVGFDAELLARLLDEAVALAVTGDELIDLQDSVKDVYQAGAMWVMSPKTRTAIRKRGITRRSNCSAPLRSGRSAGGASTSMSRICSTTVESECSPKA